MYVVLFYISNVHLKSASISDEITQCVQCDSKLQPTSFHAALWHKHIDSNHWTVL